MHYMHHMHYTHDTPPHKQFYQYYTPLRERFNSVYRQGFPQSWGLIWFLSTHTCLRAL